MNGFTVKNYQGSAAFELELLQKCDVDCIDALVRTRYEFEGRTIGSTNRWSFGLSEVSWFLEMVINMYKNLKGCSRFASFDNDELYMSVDEYGYIDVQVKEGISQYNGRVEFKFTIDQSYIPELIAQLTDFIEANR